MSKKKLMVLKIGFILIEAHFDYFFFYTTLFIYMRNNKKNNEKLDFNCRGCHMVHDAKHLMALKIGLISFKI